MVAGRGLGLPGRILYETSTPHQTGSACGRFRSERVARIAFDDSFDFIRTANAKAVSFLSPSFFFFSIWWHSNSQSSVRLVVPCLLYLRGRTSY